MATPQRQSDLVSGARDYIRPRGPRLKELPPPGETWKAADIPDNITQCLRRLRRLGVIEVLQKDEGRRNMYQTTEVGWRVVQEYAEREDALLCEHGGLKNLGDGLFTCGDPTCEHRYTRDTVELLLLQNTID